MTVGHSTYPFLPLSPCPFSRPLLRWTLCQQRDCRSQRPAALWPLSSFTQTTVTMPDVSARVT